MFFFLVHLKENVDEAQRIEVFRLNSVDGSRRSFIQRYSK